MPELLNIESLTGVSLFAAFFFATFVSEDAACLTAGALAASGEISFTFAVASCFLGIVAGDLGLYWIGRMLGAHALGSGFVRRFVSEASFDRAGRWLDQRGASAVFLSRFVTGLRLPTYLAAGYLRTNFRSFTIYFVLAAAIWTPLLVGSVAFSKGLDTWKIVPLAVAVFVVLRLTLKLSSWRGRRLMIGRLRRITRWEFWPLQIFYLPVVCHVLVLAIKFRSLTVFTCANPGMPASGFVGESKHDIYAMTGAAEENRRFLLRHELVPGSLKPDEKVSRTAQFLATNDLSFPVVLKPDAGERGKGVRIVDTFDSLASMVRSLSGDYIIQEHFGAHEISVFYIRRPGESRGEIFSVTEKVFPVVKGDGVSTLEELILRDERAVCLATKYFEQNAGRLNEIPDRDREVRLIDIGTHSRGAIFRDGGLLLTPELANAIDRLSRRIDGFYFGRFDIRYESSAELAAGNFKIIELNGVTSESTNIYDPRYSIVDAYRILFRQWRIAFEIGAENMARGAQATSLKSLLSAVRDSMLR